MIQSYNTAVVHINNKNCEIKEINKIVIKRK